MKRPNTAFLLTYLCFGGFILTWWGLFLKNDDFSKWQPPASTPFSDERQLLHKALSGHFDLIPELIIQWDNEAADLSAMGVHGIQRFSPETLAAISSPLIQASDTNPVQATYLPQTYVSASFLLAICSPKEIIAIPRGMRNIPQLYEPERLNQVPLNADNCRGERLALCRPSLAFVAQYSHPTTLQMLKNQRIPLVIIEEIATLEDIPRALNQVGKRVAHEDKAALLSHLIEAGMMAIDNRLQALFQINAQKEGKHSILYLNYFQQYYNPTTKHLTGQLFSRALKGQSHLINLSVKESNDWLVPLSLEKLVKLDPDYLLIGITRLESDEEKATHLKQLAPLKAFKNQRIFFVDETVQNSPTQYCVLAYYDLFSILKEILHS